MAIIKDYIPEDLRNYVLREEEKIAKCGVTANVGVCSSGHQIIKLLRCGREWCPDCSRDGSEAHNRRIIRWLSKVQQMESLGYFVIELEKVDRLRVCRDYLRRFKKKVKDILKQSGFERGLIRYHWFGDRNPVKYGLNPHLNVVVDGEYINSKKLENIKNSLVEGLVDAGLCEKFVIVHYSFAVGPRKIYQKLKYITRATFKDIKWNYAFAKEIHGFRNNDYWGFKKWDQDEKWNLDDIRSDEYDDDKDEVLSMKDLEKLAKNVCPICGGKIEYVEIMTFDMFLRTRASMRDLLFESGGYLIFDIEEELEDVI